MRAVFLRSIPIFLSDSPTLYVTTLLVSALIIEIQKIMTQFLQIYSDIQIKSRFDKCN